MSEKELQERITNSLYEILFPDYNLKKEVRMCRYNDAFVDLMKIGKPAIQALGRALDNPIEIVADKAAWTLAMMGEPGILELIGALGGGKPNVRNRAAWAVMRIIENGVDVRLEDVRAALLESIWLKEEKYPGIRKEAAEAYSKIANAVSKRKAKLNDGILLEGTTKPPVGNKDGMYRIVRAHV